LNETQTYMDNTDWVERYAWFGAMANTPINKVGYYIHQNPDKDSMMFRIRD
jgi:hypothetical protein